MLLFFITFRILEAVIIREGGRIRRNSDSDVYSRTKEEVPLFKLKHAETKLKFLEERITVIEKEMKYFSPQFLEGCGPEERASFFKQLGISEGEKLIFLNMCLFELNPIVKVKVKKSENLFIRNVNGRFNSNCLTREVFVRKPSNQKRKLCIFL